MFHPIDHKVDSLEIKTTTFEGKPVVEIVASRDGLYQAVRAELRPDVDPWTIAQRYLPKVIYSLQPETIARGKALRERVQLRG